MSEVKNALMKFGLSENEQEAYLLLAKSGWTTVLDLSRKTEIKRSTLYRVLESLRSKGLVEIQVDDKTTYYKTTGLKNFESLIQTKEGEVKELRAGLGELSRHLALIESVDTQTTRVKFYRGKAGMQTMEWRMCEQDGGQTLIFGDAQWTNVVGNEFAEKIRAERVNRKIVTLEVLNPQHAEAMRKDGATSWTKNIEYVTKYFRHRYIDEVIMRIDKSIIIQEEAMYLFSYTDEVVGIEVANRGYAQLMRQLFRLVWNQAKVIDEFGGNDL